MRDEEEAQDVAQEAFVRAYRSLGRFDTRQPFRPWLLRIVTNLAVNSRRGARRREEMGKRYERDIEPHAAAPSAERAVETASDGTPGRDRRARGLTNLAKQFLDEKEIRA